MKKNKLLVIFLIFITLPALGNFRNELQREISQDHVAMTYQKARVILFNHVDNFDGIICSLYSPSECQRWGVESNYKYRLEHTWPQSKGADKLPANSDLHHLFVATKLTNSKRANYPFCNVAQSDWEHGGSFLGINMELETCFEPPLSAKGDVARALFYFSIRYNMPIDSKQEAILREWHQLDSVSEFEKVRNNRIEELQGNRNPFIDHPEYSERISDF